MYNKKIILFLYIVYFFQIIYTYNTNETVLYTYNNITTCDSTVRFIYIYESSIK